MAGFRALSTLDVIRVAIKSYLQSSSQDSSDLSQHDHVCWSSSVSFSEEDIKDVELVHLLLVSAEKIGSQQYDRASKLLDTCDHFSPTTGNSVQRMVHHFSKALRERLNRETGRIISKEVKGEEIMKLILNPEEQMGSSNHAYIACYKQVPFYQATLFAGIQAIIENVALVKRIHIIDLAIRSGTHCMVLMQALATQQECPLELLKMTMIGVTSNQKLEETGKRLVYFAETLHLPFSFKIAMLADLQDLKEDIFEINEGEVIAVYSPALLSYMATQHDHLETLITVLRNINPCVMAVIEVEANHHLQTFEDRFFEALFHYSAAFDCLEVCMPRCDTNRIIFEEICTGRHIRNIVAHEGEERVIRHMKIDGWRDFFNRFGLLEAELSASSLFPAELVVRNFACGSSCAFDRNGECLIFGWKGVPHVSLSVWKFQQD